MIRINISELNGVIRPQMTRQAIERWRGPASVVSTEIEKQEIRNRTQTVGRTGFLRNSVRAKLTASGFDIEPYAKYALFVDQPTRPHEIKPLRKKALAFAKSGGIVSRSKTGKVSTRFIYGGRQAKASAVIVRSVWHPGTRGVFFVDASARRIGQEASRLLDRAIQEQAKASG